MPEYLIGGGNAAIMTQGTTAKTPTVKPANA
jgi:hypothetical protein